jgi:hypothetical protein
VRYRPTGSLLGRRCFWPMTLPLNIHLAAIRASAAFALAGAGGAMAAAGPGRGRAGSGRGSSKAARRAPAMAAAAAVASHRAACCAAAPGPRGAAVFSPGRAAPPAVARHPALEPQADRRVCPSAAPANYPEFPVSWMTKSRSGLCVWVVCVLSAGQPRHGVEPQQTGRSRASIRRWCRYNASSFKISD